ncbi:MAG: hypothetical protein KF708_02770 [Pirellulales bacterium]|nr:hypothetical protein [Pirellulales bacterium]
MMHPWKPLSLAVLILTFCGCQAGVPTACDVQPADARLATNEGTHDEIREAVLRRVPTGTSYDDAKSALEAEGFRCSYLRQHNAVFLYARPTEEVVSLTSEPISLLLPLVHQRVSDVQVLDRPLDGTVPVNPMKPPKEAVSLGN